MDIANYVYREPGVTAISIHGSKLGGGYTGTSRLDNRQHGFAQAWAYVPEDLVGIRRILVRAHHRG